MVTCFSKNIYIFIPFDFSGNESNDGENVVEVDNDDVEVDPQLVGGDNVQVRIIQDEEDEDGDELYSPPPKKRRRFRK